MTAQPPPQTDHPAGFGAALAPGTTLLQGQYTVLRFLNAGNFGLTYLARDSLDRDVVVKECFPNAFCRRQGTAVQARSPAHDAELQMIIRLFTQEARHMARLHHRNIAAVHQVFADHGTAYMALDYIAGRDLQDIIADPQTDLPPAQVHLILRDLLEAVALIHAQRLLHRDIAPDNILIDDTQRPVLIDFGAARDLTAGESLGFSAMRLVKDGYSPPEFYGAGSDQTASSDLYALAATLHHLIAGDPPPQAQARLAAIAAGEADPYQPLLGRVAGYDGPFLAALDQALAVRPEDRLQSATDWLALLDRRKPPQTAPGQMLIGATIGLALVVAAGLALPGPPPEPAVAVTDQAARQAFQVDLSLRLPFQAAHDDPATIASAAPDAPDWVAPGLVVTDVNGQDIDAIADIAPLLRDLIATAEDGHITVILGLQDPVTRDRQAHVAILPVVQRLQLAQGNVFETSMVAGQWRSVVRAAPDAAAGALQSGDILLSHIPTAAPLDRRDSLPDLLLDAAADGTNRLIFAVQRDGNQWVATLDYNTVANGPI